MLNNKLEEIKDLVLLNNPYFNNAFCNVYKSVNGIVQDNEPIFPSDKLGDYFYLRSDVSGNIIDNKVYGVSDSTRGLVASKTIHLVACVKNADSETLLFNLVNTIRNVEGVSLKKYIDVSEFVVSQELQGLGNDVLNTALQRLRSDYTIVCLTFTLENYIVYKNLNCFDKPCKTC